MHRFIGKGFLFTFLVILAAALAPSSVLATALIITGGSGGTGASYGSSTSFNGIYYTTSQPGNTGTGIPSYASIPATTGGSTAGTVAGSGGNGQGMDWTITSQDELGDYDGLRLTAGAGGYGGYGFTANRTAGTGGNGGNLTLIINAELNFESASSFTAGSGSIGAHSYGVTSGTNGSGGAGGNLTVTFAQEINFNQQSLSISGGDGGNSGTPNSNTVRAGTGGDGGNVLFTIEVAPTNLGSLSVMGGESGRPSYFTETTITLNPGGEGGDVTLNINDDLYVGGLATFTGGVGSTGTMGGKTVASTKTGNGGDVFINATADTYFAGGLTIRGGQTRYNPDHTANRGEGGDVIFDSSNNTITVVGQTLMEVNGAGSVASLVGNMTLLSANFIAYGDVRLYAYNYDAGYLTFRTNELSFRSSGTFTTNTEATDADATNGVYIGSLVIGDVDDQTGASVAPVYINNTNAVANPDSGPGYGFGGELTMIGVSHSVEIGQNLGALSEVSFILTTDLTGGQTILTSVNTFVDIQQAELILFTDGVDLESILRNGDTVTLINQADNNSTPIDIKTSGSGEIDDYIIKIVHSGTDGDPVYLIYLGRELAEGAEHTMAMAVGAGSLTRLGGIDLIPRMMETGYDLGETNSGNKIMMLFGLEATRETYSLNSSIDVSRLNLALGPALDIDLSNGTLLLGAFVEAGWSSYQVNNTNPNYSSGYNGDGESDYVGVGVLAGIKFDAGFHADMSVSYGRLNNHFSPNWVDYADFDLDTHYLSAHARAGYLFQINEKHAIDLYGLLLLYRQDGSEAQLRNEQWLKMDPFTSLRSRLGFTYNYQVNQALSLYAGLAWEYQFKAEQIIYVDDLAADSAIFQGHSAVLSLGMNSKVSDRFALGLDLRASVGERQGYSGRLTLGFRF